MADQLPNGYSQADYAAFQQQEATKPGADAPVWVQYGFPDTPEGRLAYSNIYNPAPAAPPAQPGSSVPALSPSTTIDGYDTSTPFGQYLAANGDDAWLQLKSTLDTYGLTNTYDWLQNELIHNRSVDQAQLDLMQQQTFKDRFPVIAKQQATGQNVWTPAQIINYEDTVRGYMRDAGLPQGFHDSNDEIQGLLANGVSPTEVQQRTIQGIGAVSQMPQDVKDQWHSLGFTTGDIVAHFLDPDVAEPLLMTQMNAAQTGAASLRSGFGQLTGDQATQISQLVPSQDQVNQGFQKLVTEKELMNSLPGENGQTFSQQDQIDAAFGNNVPLQQKLQKQADLRKAAFSGGGGYSNANQSGRTGVGTAK